VDNEGQGSEDPHRLEESADRYAFTPPEAAARIEFKRVRRVSGSPDHPDPAAVRRRRRVRRGVLLASAGLVVTLLGGLGWVAVGGIGARGHLTAAAGLFGQLQQQIRRGDVTAAQSTLNALRAETSAAREATSGLDWTVGGHLPMVGDDLAAVREVAAVLDDLAADGLPALLDVAGRMDPSALAPRHGRVDLTKLAEAAPRTSKGLAAIRRARVATTAISTEGLVDQVRDAVLELTDGLTRAERLVGVADAAARLLPSMLGAHAPRDYLLLFQNNAEVRATGGMPGAYLVLHADEGQISIVDQGTAAADLRTFDPPVRTLDSTTLSLYTERPAVFPADVNLSPDFPVAASLAREMYRRRSGRTVDGVVATDPIALSYLLKATGTVQVPKGGPLKADNAVRMLLSEAYAKYPDPVDQDAYFSRAARAIFKALLNHPGDPQAMLHQMARVAGERRLLVWSADQAEQEQLVGTVLGGRLPVDGAAAPTVGVFLNDGGGAKLSYYLTQDARLSTGPCNDDGARELTLKLTLGSEAPSSGLPKYVTGLGLSGHPYTSRTNVMVFSPTGGGLVSATEDGKEVAFGSGVERDRMVGVFTVDLPPGEQRTLEVKLQTASAAETAGPVTPRLWTTPTVRPWKSAVTPGDDCV
jgi:Protein of unknown function (DUF4012)